MKNEVRVQRDQRGLSQAALAETLGVSRQTINAIEKGRYMPSLPLAFALAEYFETTIERLFEPENGDMR